VKNLNMSRNEDLKRLSRKSRNQLRHILSAGGNDAITSLVRLRGGLGKQQSATLESILRSPALLKGAKHHISFPKVPPFIDRLQPTKQGPLEGILRAIDNTVGIHSQRLSQLARSLQKIDHALAQRNFYLSVDLISESIETYGWSHAILRRLVLIRESLSDVDDVVEELVRSAGLQKNAVVVTSLIHAYSPDQNYLTTKRSILNIIDRGAINKYSRTIARLAVQPFAKDSEGLASFLAEVEKCSLIDVVILAKFNAHLIDFSCYKNLSALTNQLGEKSLFDELLNLYPASDSESEYMFFKQNSVWLEYDLIRDYRILVDSYYDASREVMEALPPSLENSLENWIGKPELEKLVGKGRFTQHGHTKLGELEASGTVSRSAIFNYWLYKTEGQIGFDREHLLTLMGQTRDLARTVPITATRTAARLSQDYLVKLILWLLLAKRSKNELDSFQLRKLLENLTINEFDGSLVKLVEAYQSTHPYVAEYIYDIATEDFLAKLNRIAPHLSDIPDIRASLHEWMARTTGEEHYVERARAVRIDHQLNRVRNEIDDHRIYVDPSRFSSWIEDEMMLELNSALTSSGSGKKNIAVTCDEAVLTMVMTQCYSAFCSNAIFGIASYIGRRIRHGTFHGHLYSSVVNQIEGIQKFWPLMRNQQFLLRWEAWKVSYDKAIGEIIKERLHVKSKVKPYGLLQPDIYSAHKQEILTAAVNSIITNHSETKSTEGLDHVITDYCWRLAENDLLLITSHLKSQRTALKHLPLLDEVSSTALPLELRLVAEFKRELVHAIDNKWSSMYGWFKRPSNLAPKASLALLYDAVVGEVRDSIPHFNPRTEASPHGDIELVGGAYHIMYDSLAVVVSNAAKYGDPHKPVKKIFSIVNDESDKKVKRLIVEISSSICPSDRPEDVSRMIEQRKAANFDDANLYQGLSGIPKLMQLAIIRKDFSVDFLGVLGDEVRVRFSYVLEH
jgi:hypothetical protein